MLLGRFEWALAVVATAVVATIVSWYAVVWGRGGSPGRSEPASTPGVVAPPPTPVTPVAAPPAAERPPPVRPARYRFVAVRGDAWLQVRTDSQRGRVLYEGTLDRGRELRLRAARLWVRFGAASHLNLHVNGRLVQLPLFGTYDAFVTWRGVRPDPTVYEPAQATAAQSP